MQHNAVYREAALTHTLELAARNVIEGGGPFGAVILQNGVVIAESGNRVTATNDPTAHAEVSAIRIACDQLKTFDLSGCEIYSSCEPCPMCLGAIYWARLDRIFFAATREQAAAAKFDDLFLYQQIGLPLEQRSIPTQHIAHPDAQKPFDLWAQKVDRIDYQGKRI